MKKILAITVVALLLLSSVGCEKQYSQDVSEQGTNSNHIQDDYLDTEKDPFANSTITENSKFAYDLSFKEYYSPEEYVNLISSLITLTNEKSIEPVYAINDKLLFVKRTIDTYDKFEESIAIVDVNGNFTTDWNTNWGDYDIQFRAKCGDYFFIITKGYIYNYYDCDVVNQEGKVISNVHCKENRYDLGEGYVFFSLGADFGNIMNNKGEVIELQYKSVMPSYGEKAAGALEDGDEIGKISEGLFYGFSKGNINTVAYYYNTKGEVVIDLSTQAVNYEVTKLSDFSDGQARIEFIGANGKNYYVDIDKTGAFIGEPVEY